MTAMFTRIDTGLRALERRENARVAGGGEITERDLIDWLERRIAHQRREGERYRAGGMVTLADTAQAEAAYLRACLVAVRCPEPRP